MKDLDKKEAKIPRTFASAAYVLRLEKGMYGLFRDILVETDEVGKDGNKLREKSGKIGPIALLREAKEGEKVVLQTFDVESERVIELTEIDPTTGR